MSSARSRNARSRIAAALAALAALLTACGGDSGGGDFEDEPVDCAAETRDDDYLPGMVKAGQRWSFALDEAAPAPPGEGDNTWRLHIADGDSGVEGLSLAVTPWMPDHDHGTPIVPVVTDESGGDYTVAPINLWLPGLWEVTVDASDGGGDGDATDSAVFAFCIED